MSVPLRRQTRGYGTWVLRGGVLLVLLAAGWALGAALRGPRHQAWQPRSGRLRVLTTILPIYDFARQVGGPDAEVVNLLPPGVDPHEFSLAPGDVELVANADLLIANGAGLDEFLTDAVRKARATATPVVAASHGLPLLSSVEAPEPGHHESGDPHLWLDPVYARRYVSRIAAAMAGALARSGRQAEADRVKRRAKAYDAELAELDAECRSRLAAVRSEPIVAFHGAFRYLAQRYGLRIAAVWQSTPGRDPAPREVAALLRAVRAQRVKALFCEPQFSPRALEMVAADAHLPVYTLDPMETAPDLATRHYVPVMRRNLRTLQEALAG